MANVSSSNGLEKYPKLRFLGFDEPWRMYKAEDLFKNITDKNHPSETVLTIIQGKGTLPRGLSGRNIHYDETSLTGYKKVEEGDYIIHLRSFEGGLEIANESGIVSPAYTILRCYKPYAKLFYSSYFHTDEFINHVLSKSVEGIRDGRQISYEAFKWLSIPYCSLAEQEKISQLFSTLNQRIEKQQQLVDNLKKYKRGLSSSVFDEIAKSECQTIFFEDAFKLLQNNTFSRDDLSFDVGNVRNIHYGDVLIKYGTVINISETAIPCIKPDRNLGKFSAASYLRNGDIVFADTAEDYAVGKAAEIIGVTEQMILSGLHTIPCRPHDRFAPMYLGYYFSSHYFRSQIYRMIQGIKVSSISKSEIVKTTILVPSYDVQEKVAFLLSKADHLIEREEKTVDALQKMRRGLLQQLFI